MLIASATAIVVMGAVAGYSIGARTWSSDRDDAEDRIGRYTTFLTTVRGQRDQRAQLDQQTTAYIDRTLGEKLEVVDSRLRERLNRIGEDLQLRNLVVSTGRPTALPTPAKANHNKPAQRRLRDEPDFVELEASIWGEATLEQALWLVHRLESERWLKRIQQFRLEPRDNGERFQVAVRLTTLFVPEREPREVPPPADDAAGFVPYQVLVAANPFRVPPPPPPPLPPSVPSAPAPQPAPVPLPAYGYGQWRLTGVTQGPGGVEVWLHNPTTRESLTLTPGQKLQQAELVSVDGEQARFKLGDQQFIVAVGGSLDDRTPVKQ
jgi:hypothetical protein